MINRNRELILAELARSFVEAAILRGFEHEEFMKYAETAWLVLTAEPAPKKPEREPECPHSYFPGGVGCIVCETKAFEAKIAVRVEDGR